MYKTTKEDLKDGEKTGDQLQTWNLRSSNAMSFLGFVCSLFVLFCFPQVTQISC
jgi:hypothetical protein